MHPDGALRLLGLCLGSSEDATQTLGDLEHTGAIEQPLTLPPINIDPLTASWVFGRLQSSDSQRALC